MDAGGARTNAPAQRTAKSRGPDAPTLASSSGEASFRGRRWQESPVTGESAKETVKTIARGMPGDSGVTVVTNACAFYHCARGCGRIGRPAFPAPSDFTGRDVEGKTRANTRREREVVSANGRCLKFKSANASQQVSYSHESQAIQPLLRGRDDGERHGSSRLTARWPAIPRFTTRTAGVRARGANSCCGARYPAS